ncbi:MAG: hypothetical protein Q4G19_00755 [Clostridia bacterium]|nr:hypothetical protein [Clostridia bacterium]
MSGMFDGICGKVAPGLCRLSVDGHIAVRTGSGYRTYDASSGQLKNCDNFVLDIGEDCFFVLPAGKVRAGDIILAGGRPRCVVEAGNDIIKVINYEDMTVEQLLPEHHVLMGNSYMFGRIVSIFGRNGIGGKKGMSKMMKYVMLSSMLRGKQNTTGSDMLLPLLMMNGKEDLFDGLFDEPADEDEKEV